MKTVLLVFLTFFIGLYASRDFYVGMFKNNDILVAQDNLFKPRVPFKLQYAQFGRMFKCKITYFRVIDRLGYGSGPKVQIIRGGLQKNYLVLRLSAYNSPISVNIYVGCPNQIKKTTKNTTAATTTTKSPTRSSTAALDSKTTPNGTQHSNENDTSNTSNPSDASKSSDSPDSSPDSNNSPDTGNTPDTGNSDASNPANESSPPAA